MEVAIEQGLILVLAWFSRLGCILFGLLFSFGFSSSPLLFAADRPFFGEDFHWLWGARRSMRHGRSLVVYYAGGRIEAQNRSGLRPNGNNVV